MANNYIDENFIKEIPELKKFNWGACIFTFIWGIFNNSPITFLILLTFIPSPITFLAGLVLPIWFGIKGNEWALKNKKWESVEHFNHVQKLWGIWAGIIIFIILVPVIICYVIFILWVINNPNQAQEILMQLGITAK